MTVPLNSKFVRAFQITPAPRNIPNGCMLWITRLVWEFWGFCVNGGNDLLNPGGMATSNVTGSYFSFPSSYLSGSTVLLSSGSDGQTSAGLPYFTTTTSTPFSSSVEGKWLTMWQSGSISTDDSIYKIVKWINSSSLELDPTYGGTSLTLTGSIPQLSSRTNVNYRVIDYWTASNLSGFTPGNFIVFQFDAAPVVNTGQAKSQFKLSLNSAGGTVSQPRLTLSPSGSWNGSTFVGETYSDILPDVDLGPGSVGWGSADWFHNTTIGDGSVTLIAGTGFLICQAGGNFMSAGSMFHVEIPERLYPQINDPNPMCAANVGNLIVTTACQNGYGWASHYMVSPYDNTSRRWSVVTRSLVGSYYNSSMFTTKNSLSTLDYTRWHIHYNRQLNNVLMPEGMLSLVTINGQTLPGQFSLARAKLRTTKYLAGLSKYARVGSSDGGRWINVGAGVFWPWDHALVPRLLFAGTL